MQSVRLHCPWCGSNRRADLNPWCQACGGTLTANVERPFRLPSSARSLGDFATLLPVGRRLITLHEGGTPLIPLTRARPSADVYVKAEWMNPTGSFKDRGAAVGVSAALELGAAGVVCASTGNNAAAVSAYAARGGLPCIVTLPDDTARGKVAQASAHGARVIAVEGDFSEAYRLAERIREKTGWANLTSTFLNPYLTAAHRTISYELALDLDGDIGSIIVPIGAGPMLVGILDGLRQLKGGILRRWPVLVGVQASGCAPIARAFAVGANEVEAWPDVATGIAQSLKDPLRSYPADGTRTLRAVREAGGQVVAVDDVEILQALDDLATLEGMGCEPAGAAPLAALRRIDTASPLPRPVVLIGSGHLLKDPERHPRAAADHAHVRSDVDVGAIAAGIQISRARSSDIL